MAVKPALSSLLVALCLVLPRALAAEERPYVHQLSITLDEEGERLSSPTFVFAEPVMKELYVLSSSRVCIYDEDYYPMYTFGKGRGVETPVGLAVDAEGYVYVAQAPAEKGGKYRVSVFNPSFRLERDIHLEGFEGDDSFTPSRVAVGGKGLIYVAGSGFPGVPVIHRDGRLEDFLQPMEDDRKIQVNDVAVGGDGRIYLLSAETSHVYVYDENRRFLFSVGKKGGSSGKMSRPVGIDVDNRSGLVYVVDYMRHTVLVHDREGKYVNEFGGLGWGAGWFQYPSDLTVDSTGRIIVADTFNNRVEVFSPARGGQ